MTGGRFSSVAALRVSAPSDHPSKDPPAFTPWHSLLVPAGLFPVDSRCRQRSIALNHIPPLHIPHGLEYPLGSRMHLGVVDLRLEARGRPFPRSPRPRSPMNPRVLRSFTRDLSVNPHSCGHLRAVLKFRTFFRLPVVRLPMVGPWFTTPWRLVSQSHGAVARYFLPPLFPWFAGPRRPIPLCHIPSPITAYSPRPVLSGSHGAVVQP